ncbi:MAG: FeoA family protein [Candidatus Omnitrophota bacterium]
MILDLTKLRHDEEGVIAEFDGGSGFSMRMEKMGIRTGKRIKKISSHFWGGPQTIEIDKARFAIGHGMAKKVLVEVDR